MCFRKHVTSSQVGILLIWSLCATTVSPQTVRRPNAGIQSVSQVPIPQDTMQLDLSHNRIARLVTDDFLQLSSLQILSLTNNMLSTIENDAFRGLVALQTLYLQDNAIMEFPDLSDLRELREIYLQNNAISNLPNNVLLPTANKVERLDLSGNRFTSVPNEFLRHFATLKYLNLCCGTLVVAPPVYEIIGSLQILDIQSTQISTLQAQSFTGGNSQSSLQELVLENNTCTIEAGLFKNMPNLLILNLNRVGLSELPDLTGNLNNLREFHVAGNSLRFLDSSKFYGTPPDYSQTSRLISVNAASNDIISVSSDFFRASKKLQTVNLGFNNLSSFPLSSLSDATDLRTINLQSNQITTLENWGLTRKTNLSIDISDNPLDCNNLCWFFLSGFASFDASTLRSQYPCQTPPSLSIYTWEQFSSSSEAICGTQDKATTTKADVGGDKQTKEGSSGKLEIIIGVAVAVFVVAAILAILSVLKFCVWGKKEPDVILIGRGGSRSQKVDSEDRPSDNGSVRREHKGKRSRPASQSNTKNRHSRSPRLSRLQTISEKSEETNLDRTDRGTYEKEDVDTHQNSDERRKQRNSKRSDTDRQRSSGKDPKKDDRQSRSSKQVKRVESFDRDPTVSQEIPYEFTYRV